MLEGILIVFSKLLGIFITFVLAMAALYTIVYTVIHFVILS